MKSLAFAIDWCQRGARLVLLAVALFLLQSTGVAQYLGPLSAISINFEKGSALSDRELVQVVTLAGKAGITNISKISTYYLLPSSVIGVAVDGAEKVKGRKVSFASVHIETKGLIEEMSRNVTNIFWSEGKFWVSRLGFFTNTLTLFQMKGDTIRIKVGEKVPLAQADKIVAALSAGKIRYADESIQQEGRRINISRPESMYVDRKTDFIYVTYSCGNGCDVSFRCTLDKNGVLFSNPIISIA